MPPSFSERRSDMPAIAIEAVSGVHPYGSPDELHALLLAGARPYAERGDGECPPEAFAQVKALGPSLRRTPRLARLALASLLQLPHFREGRPADAERCALVVATAFGSVKSTFDFMDSLLADGPDMASPTAFSHSVTNMTAAMLGQHLGLSGPALTATDAGSGAFRAALVAAAGMLANGGVDRVFLCAVEERHAPMDAVIAAAAADTPSPEGAIAFALSAPSGGEGPRFLVPPFGESSLGGIPRIPPAMDVYGPGTLALAWNCALTALSMRKEPSAQALCLAAADADERDGVLLVAGADS